ncbi:Uncharacterised protein [Bordetella pertussis]|nr:Uncharacterised protein [Bordetella pertussis]
MARSLCGLGHPAGGLSPPCAASYPHTRRLSPSNVENTEDSLGAAWKSPIESSTCKR